MAAKRKIFTCKCGVKTSQTISNANKQYKRLGYNRCAECSKKVNAQKASQRLLKQYSTIQKNSDIVEVNCICGTKKRIQYRALKKHITTYQCKSCKQKEQYKKHKIKYDNAAKTKMTAEIKAKISAAVSKLDSPQRRKEQSKRAKALWNNSEYKNKSLETRSSTNYRKKMSEIWDRPGYRNKMRQIASIKAIELWKDNDYKIKMAKIRAKQLTKPSKIQIYLYDYLKDLNVEYIEEHPIGPWTFDCYLPNFNLLIECQGDYWHSLPKAIKNDKAKSTYIRQYTSLKILYLYEHEFYTKDQILFRLAYELGIKTDQIDFKIKDVNIKSVNASEINAFMYKYHYIGPRNNAQNFGFFLDNKLIACCSYNGITRKQSATRLSLEPNQVKELGRFCIHHRYHKKNFASRCIAQSIKLLKKSNNKTKALIAFADPILGHSGTIYKAANWKYDGKTAPSYYYINNDGWVMHKKTLWNKSKQMTLTENEYASKYGYIKKKTPPKLRFIFDMKSIA